MPIELKHGDECKNDAFAIRIKVFMEEQGYTDEFDAIDEKAIQVVLYQDDTAIGCGRTFAHPNHHHIFYIGRIAVLPEYRKAGFGKMLVEGCEVAAKEAGATEIQLHAQAYLEDWYYNMGYAPFGEIDYEDEGQPHLWMKKSL